MIEILVLLAGTLYGLLIGIIPAVGATTGLVAIFGFIHLFPDPYLAVIFCMATVAASTTGDTYAGVLLGIPGANSAAATMVDGFPLALQGKANYAIAAAITTSTINGLLWGSLVFFLLPWYTQLMLIFGIPELWAFTVLALATVAFVSSVFWVRSIVALIIGIVLGFVGIDPATNVDRLTLGWGYLANGIQLMPLAAGLFAIPEMIAGLFVTRKETVVVPGQTMEGIKAVWKHKWLALRGGAIGAFFGVLPGLGGAVADWTAYGQAVATTKNPDPPFGKGNIRGVIGPEGANNAQKATSMIPTVLFGIPGASFAAILMALFMYLGFELGSPDLAGDAKFFGSLTFGFMWATVLVGFICLFSTKYIVTITNVPYKYYFPVLLSVVIWASMQYTGGWEDFFILVACTAIGMFCRRYKFSRPALLIGFILAERIEALSLQMFALYDVDKLLGRPIFVTLMVVTLAILIWGIRRKPSIEYA